MSAPWILTGIAPNLEPDDVRLAWRELLHPSGWTRGDDVAALERAMQDATGAPHATAFVSGRAALAAALTACGVGEGDEVLLQAFTCVVVPDAVRWVGATPVFVDCDAETFNLSLAELEQRVTPKTKAVIFQHTFGSPAGIEDVVAFAVKHHLALIEDAAHVIGGSFRGTSVGSFGHAAVFSFGRDKPVSSVFGGMAVTADAKIAARLRDIQSRASSPSRAWTLRQLLHGPILSFATRHYGNVLGRGMLAFARTFRLISLAVGADEKRGARPRWTRRRMPPALARLARHQLAKLDRFNAHRREMERAYRAARPDLAFQKGSPDADAPLLRLTVLLDHPDRVRAHARAARIVLGNWYDTPVAPSGTDLARIGYHMESCSTAEWLATRAVNLPTDIHVRVADVPRILAALSI